MKLMYTQYKLLDLVEGKQKMQEAGAERSMDEALTHATGIVLLVRRLRDIKFFDGESMQPVLDEMRDIFTKLQGGGVVYSELVQCVKIVIRLPESWSALAINLNSQQPQWSVDYIRAHIVEEDLRRRSVERSEEGAGYGVGGGKSGFKKKWKGKNKDNPKEDGGRGQGEVCFYQQPKNWTPPSSSNQHGGKRSGGVIRASEEERDDQKGDKSGERKARKSGKAAAAASMEESVTVEEQQGVQGDELIGGSAVVKASATLGQADWETWHQRLAHAAVSTLEVMPKEKCVHRLQLQGDGA
ncbi:unnamed protein product [Closterium sp. NIES-65]|nr:unnamed protein product [Closterium sp. NIES-65]